MKKISKSIEKQNREKAVKLLESAAEILKGMDVPYDDYRDIASRIYEILSSDNGECGLKHWRE